MIEGNPHDDKILSVRVVRPPQQHDTTSSRAMPVLRPVPPVLPPPPPRRMPRELSQLTSTMMLYPTSMGGRRRTKRARVAAPMSSMPSRREPEIVEIISDTEPEAVESEEDGSCNAVEIIETRPGVATLRLGEIVHTPFGRGLIRQRLYRSRRSIGYQVTLDGDLDAAKAFVQSDQVEAIGENVLATYRPANRPKAFLTLSEYDYGRLTAGEYLNDTIIEFYLSYMTDHFLSRERKAKQLIYSTFFFARYRDRVEGFKRQHRTKTTAAAAFAEAYKAVSKWTQGVNIFEKKYLFIPINESMHWSLAVVCHLDQLRPSIGEDETEETENKGDCPCILILDSMKSHRTQKTAGYIRK